MRQGPRHAPNLADAVLDLFTRTPVATELSLPNMREGDPLVGAFTNGQIGYHRPFFGAGTYRAHLPGLYPCGSSSHPGGNITGLPGYNAAQVILADLGIRKDWMPMPIADRLALLSRRTDGTIAAMSGAERLITRTTRVLLSLAILAGSALTISAQDYPSRPVEVVVPFPAGGGTEIVTRLVSEGLAKRLGQPFVVINRPGANTNLGTLAVVRSKPDGYTLLITSFGLAANPSLYRNLGFEPQADLDPITTVANSPTVLTVPLTLPVNSLPEFIDYVKARPGELNYASYGVGSSPHLGAVLFQSMTGTKMAHIPYNGGGPAALGVMTNQVQALFSSVVTVLGMLRGGSLKAIAIASERRSELLPNVPTFAEQGLDYRTGTWYGMLAPAKTPPAIIDTLHRTSASALADPNVKTRIIEQGAEVVANSPDEFRTFLKEETERLGRVIREYQIKID